MLLILLLFYYYSFSNANGFLSNSCDKLFDYPLSEDKSVVNSKLYGFIPLDVSSIFSFFLSSYKSAYLGVIPLLYLDPPDKSLLS